MTDLAAALQKAVYDRLVAMVTLAPVFEHVPETQRPPVTFIADMSMENQGTKDDPLYRFDLTIATFSPVRGRKALSAIQTQVRNGLDRWRPAAMTGATFGEIRLASEDAQQLATEGGEVIYYGTQIFNGFVQAV
jgi:hypothetical protein